MYTTHSLVLPTALSFEELERLVKDLAFLLQCDEETMFEWARLYLGGRGITVEETEEEVIKKIIEAPVMVVEMEAVGCRMGLTKKEFNIFAATIGDVIQRRWFEPPKPPSKEEKKMESRVVH